MEVTLDVVAYRLELHRIEDQIRSLKSMLRTTWVRPMADEQRELCRTQLRATELYVLRAFMRGKIHRRTAPHGHQGEWNPEAYQRRIAERLGPAFAIAIKESA